MHVLIIGYGSIGKKHAQIIVDLKCHVSLVTTQKLDKFPCYLTIEDAFDAQQFDYVIIANPTALHFESLLELIRLHFTGIVLVEKSLFSRYEALPSHSFQQLFVGYNLRFHSILQTMKSILDDEQLINFSAYVGQYLPSWRENKDYRQSYSASKMLGGGVLRDLSHELDYTLWLCGSWLEVTALGGHWSDLDIDSEDVCNILMQCDKCPVVNIHINYLDRHPRRQVLMNTKKHTYAIDLRNGLLQRENEVIMKTDHGMIETYRSQHQSILEGKHDYCCTYEEGIQVLKLIEAAETSMDERRWIKS